MVQKKKTIELGHQGEPVVGVILRIYRQTEENSKRNGIEFENKEKVVEWRRKKETQNKSDSYYSKRVSLSGSCDDVCFSFFFRHFLLCFISLFIFYFRVLVVHIMKEKGRYQQLGVLQWM